MGLTVMAAGPARTTGPLRSERHQAKQQEVAQFGQQGPGTQKMLNGLRPMPGALR
jgi:hypothetical protein